MKILKIDPHEALMAKNGSIFQTKVYSHLFYRLSFFWTLFFTQYFLLLQNNIFELTNRHFIRSAKPRSETCYESHEVKTTATTKTGSFLPLHVLLNEHLVSSKLSVNDIHKESEQNIE